MFDSIYSASVTPQQFFLMMAASLLSGLLYAWLMSFRVRSHSRFFTVTALLPFAVGAVITFVNGNIGAGVAIGGAFGLVRFRSAQGSSEEIAAIFVAMASGIAFGMGYLAYGALMLLLLAGLYLLLGGTELFRHRALPKEQMLSITIPEALEYNGCFDAIFARYLRRVEAVGVKTTGMGSLFRLSYRIEMADETEEKAFIDEIRTKNGNLEVSILPCGQEAVL